MVYYKETRKAERNLVGKKGADRGELYRFVSTITQELKSSKNVLSMLEHYKERKCRGDVPEGTGHCVPTCVPAAYEAALTRFEARLNSPQLSDVVRGLIGVLRGDDGAVYFRYTTSSRQNTEVKEQKAAKIRRKSVFFFLPCSYVSLQPYFAIIGYEIVKSMGTLF